GAEAVELCIEHDVDVIVADQRMPEMEGVEVLGLVRERSPRTMRILLTGYADLDAIEGSINVGEVFRFLSKPCPPDALKATIEMAVKASDAPVLQPTESLQSISQTAPQPIIEADDSLTPAAEIAPQTQSASKRKSPSLVPKMLESVTALRKPAEPEPQPEITPEALAKQRLDRLAETGEQVILAGDSVESQPGDSFEDVNQVGVIVFTLSDDFFAEVDAALGGRYPIYHANRLVKILEMINEGKAGVLISEVSSEGSVLRKILNKFKLHLPELIAIVVSDDRDAAEMISLINHGQVFRYMAKPISHDRLRQNVNGGVLRHLQLRSDPSLIPRMQVDTSDELDRVSANGIDKVVSKIKSLGRFWRRS
ncbi:MAG: response regulator, partial [Pseudomonadota bacterium]